MEPLEANANIIKLAKEQIDLLAKDWLTQDLTHLMRKVRQEPGLTLNELSWILKKCFDQSELDVLKKLI